MLNVKAQEEVLRSIHVSFCFKASQVINERITGVIPPWHFFLISWWKLSRNKQTVRLWIMWIDAAFSRKKNVGFGFMREFKLYILHNGAALWIIIVRLTRLESSCVVVWDNCANHPIAQYHHWNTVLCEVQLQSNLSVYLKMQGLSVFYMTC